MKRSWPTWLGELALVEKRSFETPLCGHRRVSIRAESRARRRRRFELRPSAPAAERKVTLLASRAPLRAVRVRFYELPAAELLPGPPMRPRRFPSRVLTGHHLRPASGRNTLV